MNTSIRNKFIYIYSSLAIVFITLSIITYFLLSPVTKYWQEYKDSVIEKQVILLDIKSNLGYGGFIHQYFKYLTYKNEEAYLKAVKSLEKLTKTTSVYKYLKINDAETKALNIIDKHLEKYGESLAKIRSEYQNNLDQHNIAMDNMIDDTPALKAYNTLYQNITESSDNILNILSKKISALMFAIMVTLAITLAIAISVILVINKGILKNINSLKKGMAEVAHGTSDLTIRLNEQGQDELSNTTGSFNVFIKKLQNVILEIIAIIKNLGQNSNEMVQCAAHSKNIMATQSERVREVTSLVSTAYATVGGIANNASVVAKSTLSANQEASTIN
ncbi:MAG: methyl-accepting chemotaxis protein, partial [Romboutsia sp.]|nr:methyl-accepting chemotaxis protein [Romboutsia sp.]